MPGKKRAAAPAEEEEFPRGGGSSLAPIVHKQLKKDAYAEAEADLFGTDATNRGKKRRKNTSVMDVDVDEEDAFFSKLSAHDKLPKFVELLKFKNLNKGMKLWGSIGEIFPNELIINLPHGLKGHVAYNDASDFIKSKDKQPQTPLSSLFKPGQFVRCIITQLKSGSTENNDGKKTKQKKKISLSLHISKVSAGLGADAIKEGAALPACVKSIEDYGYILSFGIKGTSGFLPKKEVSDGPLHVGALIDVVVQSVKKSGVENDTAPITAHVTASPTAVATAVTKEWGGIHIGSLLPGSLVNARVRTLLSDGLLVSFLTFFTATIDPYHLGKDALQQSDWKKKFSENQRVKARILYVDPESKHVGLSLQRHLLDNTKATDIPAMGHVFDAAVVRRVDPGLGIIIELPDHSPGFAHISNIADEKIEKIEERFRPGQIVRCRVIGSRAMDGIAAVSLKPSVVDQSMLSVTDITVGMPVSGTVAQVEDSTLLLQLTPHLRALVPPLHISDVVSQRSTKKFKLGQKVSGKILSVDPETKKIAVTLKPSLVNSKLPIITSIEDALAVGKSQGVITGIQEYGIFVTFFNNVSGLVPKEESGLPDGQTVQQAFSIGQIVRPRVTGSHAKTQRLRLSLLSKKKAAEMKAHEADVYGGLEPGSIVSGIVTSVHKNDEGTAVLYMDVALYSDREAAAAAHLQGTDVENIKPIAVGRLEMSHLGDHPGSIEAFSEIVDVGLTFDTLLVLQKLENAKKLRVTRKASLVTAASTLPQSISDLKEGALYQGYVASIASDAVFVRFLGDLTGRAGLAQLADTFVSDPHAHFTLGQSVQAHVVQVDAPKKRFSVSLKYSVCNGNASASTAVQYIQSYFDDCALAHRLTGDKTGGTHDSTSSNVDWHASFPIGKAIKATVHELKSYGLLCDLPQHEDLVGVIDTTQLPGGGVASTPAQGTAIEAVVLDYSEKDGVVDMSLLPQSLARASAIEMIDAGNDTTAAAAATKRKKSKRNKKGVAEEENHVNKASHTPDTTQQKEDLHIGDEIITTVILSKPEEGYCVVSLFPEEGNAVGRQWIGFVPTSDYNYPPRSAKAQQPQHGDTITATVAQLDTAPSRHRRILLTTPLSHQRPASGANALGASSLSSVERKKDAKAKAKAAKKALPKIGSIHSAKITAIHSLHADVSLEEVPVRGRIHITEAIDPETLPRNGSPLSSFVPGSTLQVVALGKMQSAEGKRHNLYEFSSRASTLAAAEKDEATPHNELRRISWKSIVPGQKLQGYIQEVSGEYIWVVLTPNIRGRIFLPRVAKTLEECISAHRVYKIGSCVEVAVHSIDAEKKSLDLTLSPPRTDAEKKKKKNKKKADDCDFVSSIAQSIEEAQRDSKPLLGMVSSVSGTGVLVKLAPGSNGRVALTDIHDGVVKNALQGLHPGQFVQVALLHEDAKKKGHYNVSLKPSRGGDRAGHAVPTISGMLPEDELDISQVKIGQKIGGYVKSAGKTGVFVCLSRDIDARIKLRQLSDSFIENPTESFPEGCYVEGTVLNIEGGKVDMTLRQHTSRPVVSLESLEEGQIVHGKVRKVETFGVFIELDGSGACGLAHVSELADDFVKDIAGMFKIDQRVVARVLSVDKKTSRLSLGLKPSYFEDVDEEEEGGEEGHVGDGADFDDEIDAAMHDSDDSEDSSSEDMDEDGKEGQEFDLDEDLLEGESDESQE